MKLPINAVKLLIPSKRDFSPNHQEVELFGQLAHESG